MRYGLGLSASLLWVAIAINSAPAQDPSSPIQPGGDIPAQFEALTRHWDYDRRDLMVPMRDGVKLHVILVVPHDVTHGPIMLDRTPYGVKDWAEKTPTPYAADVLSGTGTEHDLLTHGYIVALSDVRGKYGSEGDYVMNRPLIGPLNHTKTDHATDAYDTIDWLVHHVPESNGRVGTYGTSYDGFTTLMSLIHPHPALRAAVPMDPMVDVWIGDDWFHHGAFRQEMMGYLYWQTVTKDSSRDWWSEGYDDYPIFLDHVSAGAYGSWMGMDRLPVWNRISHHPAYDAFWQDQAVDKRLAGQALTVPTLFVAGQWDQEDIYGAIAAYEATAAKGEAADRFLAMGPWFHGQENIDAKSLGAFDWDGDTGAWFRRHVMLPFLDRHLKDDAASPAIAPVTVFQTGTDEWRAYDTWPLACATCTDRGRALYLEPNGGLGFATPTATAAASDDYVSDPDKPVPYRPRPDRTTYAKNSGWQPWLVGDQRFAESRPDVLTYVTAPLASAVTLSGAPVAHLFASTTGTDADWVVKLIDAYPPDDPEHPELGGFELGVAMDILRGRYRDDPAHPSPIPANKVVAYTLALPNVDHVFLRGHRIMVQVQSTWFPLYDRNPQTYVPNIFFAKPSDYVRATDRVFHAPGEASFVQLPVVPDDAGRPIP